MSIKLVTFCFLQCFISAVGCQAVSVAGSEQKSLTQPSADIYVAEGQLYRFDQSGTLQMLNPANGVWTLGGNGYHNVKYLFADQEHMVIIDHGGTLFEIDKASGKKVQLGLGGSWSAVTAGAFFNGLLYVVEKSGSINTIDLENKNWNQLSSLGFSDIKGMWLSNGKFYLLQIDGSLYAVSPKNGSWEQVGSHQIWANTFSGAILDEFLYTCDVTGKYYKTNLLTGNITRLEADNSNELVMLSTRNNKIMVIKKDGSISTLKAE